MVYEVHGWASGQARLISFADDGEIIPHGRTELGLSKRGGVIIDGVWKAQYIRVGNRILSTDEKQTEYIHYGELDKEDREVFRLYGPRGNPYVFPLVDGMLACVPISTYHIKREMAAPQPPAAGAAGSSGDPASSQPPQQWQTTTGKPVDLTEFKVPDKHGRYPGQEFPVYRYKYTTSRTGKTVAAKKLFIFPPSGQEEVVEKKIKLMQRAAAARGQQSPEPTPASSVSSAYANPGHAADPQSHLGPGFAPQVGVDQHPSQQAFHMPVNQAQFPWHTYTTHVNAIQDQFGGHAAPQFDIFQQISQHASAPPIGLATVATHYLYETECLQQYGLNPSTQGHPQPSLVPADPGPLYLQGYPPDASSLREDHFSQGHGYVESSKDPQKRPRWVQQLSNISQAQAQQRNEGGLRRQTQGYSLGRKSGLSHEM
jgi:hypothetical protein